MKDCNGNYVDKSGKVIPYTLYGYDSFSGEDYFIGAYSNLGKAESIMYKEGGEMIIIELLEYGVKINSHGSF